MTKKKSRRKTADVAKVFNNFFEISSRKVMDNLFFEKHVAFYGAIFSASARL